MALPEPAPGLVLRYSYLWRRERDEGRHEGRKDRPCAIVVALRRADAAGTRVLVLPVTHDAPHDPDTAVELPPRVKRRLGLDDARSWVV